MKTIHIDDLAIGQDESCRAYSYFLTGQALKRSCESRLDVIECLRVGYPYYTIDIILDQTCVSRKDLSHILHISTRQLNRYDKDGLLPAELSGPIYEFSRIYARGVDILGDRATFEGWLNRPQLALGGQVPLHLLDTTEGIRLVNDLLSQIEFGFYS